MLFDIIALHVQGCAISNEIQEKTSSRDELSDQGAADDASRVQTFWHL